MNSRREDKIVQFFFYGKINRKILQNRNLKIQNFILRERVISRELMSLEQLTTLRES